MPTDNTDIPAAVATASKAVSRCGCGRLAMARCWLGENSPARWLFSCDRQSRLPPDTPESA